MLFQGVKSGEILLNADILPPGTLPPGFMSDPQGHPAKDGEKHPADDDALAGRHGRPSTSGGKKSGNLGDHDGPILHVDLIKAKNLIKSDIIGKSDPYAVLKYADQTDKTPVVKNSQNPQWDHPSDFAMNHGDPSSLM